MKTQEACLLVDSVHTPGDASSLFVIRESGSYYLTANILGEPHKNGIGIAANRVTLDLNGFSVAASVGLTMNGISVLGPQDNIVVMNGIVCGWGKNGVDAGNASHGRFENISAFGNGTGYPDPTHFASGIVVGDCNIVRGCVSNTNSSTGIGTGSGCLVVGCVACRNRYDGILSGQGCSVTGCVVQDNREYGILLGREGFVSGCNASGNAFGIVARAPTPTPSPAPASSDGRCRIDGNHVGSYTQVGIGALSPNNVIIRNTVHGGPSNYDVGSGNDVGPIGTASAATSPWANISH